MSIAIEVLSILETAHAHGVIHRDIKPDNIFIVLLATPAFVAPEQAWDRVDARSDIYSLGATMWRLVCEHGMHRASTVQELLKVAATAPVRPIRELLPDLHSPIARVIDKALAFDPHPLAIGPLHARSARRHRRNRPRAHHPALAPFTAA